MVVLRSRIVIVLSVCGVLSVILNGVIIYVMLKTPRVRRNAANLFIFAILAIDLLFGAMLPIMKQVNK